LLGTSGRKGSGSGGGHDTSLAGGHDRLFEVDTGGSEDLGNLFGGLDSIVFVIKVESGNIDGIFKGTLFEHGGRSSVNNLSGLVLDDLLDVLKVSDDRFIGSELLISFLGDEEGLGLFDVFVNRKLLGGPGGETTVENSDVSDTVSTEYEGNTVGEKSLLSVVDNNGELLADSKLLGVLSEGLGSGEHVGVLGFGISEFFNVDKLSSLNVALSVLFSRVKAAVHGEGGVQNGDFLSLNKNFEFLSGDEHLDTSFLGCGVASVGSVGS